MRRRELITLLGAAAVCPLVARAQQPADLPEIGLLYPGPATAAAARAEIVWEGLEQSGFAEGKNLALVSRAADSNPEAAATTGMTTLGGNIFRQPRQQSERRPSLCSPRFQRCCDIPHSPFV